MKFYLKYIFLLFALHSLLTFAQTNDYSSKRCGGDSNGVVGKINADFSVSSSGQAIYEIPLDISGGTGGMSPKLSVTYSSSTGVGLFGWGADLQGLSIISRVPSTLYHDGKSGCADLNTARFALDGNRLFLMEKKDGNCIYSCENDNYARIIAYGDQEESPSSFVINTKDGLTYLYEPNTKLIASSSPTLFWVVTKVSDSKGNYFKVSYKGDASVSEIYPVRIDYTYNDKMALTAYASVQISYLTDSNVMNSYIAGLPVKKYHRISSIDMCLGSQTIKSYNFSYKWSNGYNLLNEISEKGSDGSSVNPTKLEWSNVEEIGAKNVLYSTTDIKHEIFTVGDFNGDGKDDIFATPENTDAGWSGYKIYQSEGDSLRFCGRGYFAADGQVVNAVSGDFNGDGYCDVVVQFMNGRFYQTDLYLATPYGLSASFAKPITIYNNPNKYSIQAVEFNGDGITDLFLWYDGKYECNLMCSKRENGKIIPLQSKYNTNLVKWDRVEFIDYNGDGITDILNLDDNGCTIISSNGDGNFSQKPIKLTYPKKKHHISFGDFDGDGKTDFLLTGYDQNQTIDPTWKNWFIYPSDGTGQYSSRNSISLNPYFKEESYDICVMDFDGDGHDDIMAVEKGKSSCPLLFLNYGIYFVKKNYSSGAYGFDSWHYYFGDFNGDGKKDFVCTSRWIGRQSWKGYQLYLMPDTPNKLVTKITDGMDNTIDIEYKYMSDRNVYTRNNVDYPLVSTYSSSLPLVYQVSTPDGNNGTHTIRYKYENGLRHYGGRGCLGFLLTKTTDLLTNTVTEQKYGFETAKCVLVPTNGYTYVKNKLVSSSKTTYELFENKKNSYVFNYLPVEIENRSYEYNTKQLIRHIINTMEYGDYGNVTKITSVDGDVTSTTTNEYNDNTEKWYLGRLTKSVVKKVYNGYSETRTSTFEYDPGSGLLSAEEIEPSNKNFRHRKVYFRDGYGNIAESAVVPLNGKDSQRTTISSYDSQGRYVISETNSLGHIVSKTIDYNRGIVVSVTDAIGNVTEYEYDGFGNIKKESNSLSTTYSITGWSQGMEDAPENSKYFSYSEKPGEPSVWVYFDRLGRSVRRVTENYNGTKKIYCDFVYNPKGQLVKKSEPYFSGDTKIYWTTTEYDDCGRIIKQTDPDGSVSAIEYKGLITTATDAKGHTTTKEENLQGWLIRSTDNNGVSINYTYDASGRNREIEGPNKYIQMDYDIMGNRIYLYDSDLGTVQSKYNTYGELIETEDDNGTVKFEYDQLGRTVKEIRPDMTVTHVYDTNCLGLLTSTESSNGVTKTYTYDKYGRIKSINQSDKITNSSFSVSYTYTENNQVKTISYPESSLRIRNVYSKKGKHIRTENISSSATVEIWRSTSENARGDIETEYFGSNMSIESITKYSPETGRIIQMTTKDRNNNNRILLNWSYKYDANGCLTERKDHKRGLTENFTYDNLDRLLTASKNGTIYQEMEYDDAGNILSKSDVGQYVYKDGTNILSGLISTSYKPKEWDEIQYTSFNKISKIVTGDNVLELTYGPSKQRVVAVLHEKRIITSKVYFDNLYEKIIKNGEITRKCYIFAAGKCVAVHETKQKTGSTYRAPCTYYVHHDHLGSVQAYTNISNSAAELALELSYDAWGRRRDVQTWEYTDGFSDDGKYLDRGFGGHEHLDLFDLVNMDGRMYDPVIGRFLSPDPFIQAPDFTQSLNRYSYCINNPLSLIDPSGYSWLGDNWKSIVASCVGAAVSYLTAGIGSGLGAAIIAGACGGAAGAFTGALLNGANIGQIAKATFLGGLQGAASGFLNFAAGEGQLLERIFKHCFTEAMMEGVQGGNIAHGLISGAIYGLSDTYIGGNASMPDALKVSASVVIGGTVSELGGGKFANGAITSAFSMMFNGLMHKDGDDPVEYKLPENFNTNTDNSAVGTIALSAENPYLFSAVASAYLIYNCGEGIMQAASKVYDAVSSAVKKENERIWVTYTLNGPDGKIYVGRTSGFGTPEQIVARRYANHHMQGKGYHSPKVDKYAMGPWRSPAYDAIRGREQQMMDFHGGVGSTTLGNSIRGVSKTNRLGIRYHKASNALFGQLYRYTGFYYK